MSQHPELSGRFLTKTDVAALTGKTEGSLAQDRYLGRGLPYIKFGAKILYDRADVEAYLASCKVTPGASS